MLSISTIHLRINTQLAQTDPVPDGHDTFGDVLKKIYSKRVECIHALS